MLKKLITKRSHAHVVTSFFGQAILIVGGAVVEHFAVYAGIILCFVVLSSSEEEIVEVWFRIDSGQLGVGVEIIDGVAIVFQKIILSPEAITPSLTLKILSVLSAFWAT